MSELNLQKNTQQTLDSLGLTAVVIAGPKGKILDEKLYQQVLKDYNRQYCTKDVCTISPDNIAVAGEGEDFDRTFKLRLAGQDKFVPQTSIIGLVDKEGKLVNSNVLELYPVQNGDKNLKPGVLNTYSMYKGGTTQEQMIALSSATGDAAQSLYGNHIFVTETNPRNVIVNAKGSIETQKSVFGTREAGAKLGVTESEFNNYVHDLNASKPVLLGANSIAVQIKGGYIPVNLESEIDGSKIKSVKAAAALISGIDEKGEARNGEHLLLSLKGGKEVLNDPNTATSVTHFMENFYKSVATENLGVKESLVNKALNEIPSYKKMQEGISAAFGPAQSVDTANLNAQEVARNINKQTGKA